MVAFGSGEEAWRLRLAGKSVIEIAEELGVADPGKIGRVLTERYGHEAALLTEVERKALLALEMARLDALQNAVWGSAMMGDPKSVDSAVKIVATRAKIAGLEQIDPVVQKNLVLVMGEKEEDYIAALKRAGSD